MEDDWSSFEFYPLSKKPYNGRAIYFLFNSGEDGFQNQVVELVYIGQTKNLHKRLATHDSKLNEKIYVGNRFIGELMFDSYFYIPVDSDTDQRLLLESFYIDKYYPKLNTEMCSNYIEGWMPFTELDHMQMKNYVEGWRPEANRFNEYRNR